MMPSDDPKPPRRDDEEGDFDSPNEHPLPQRRRKTWRDEDEFHRDKRDDVTDDFDENYGDKRELALAKVRVPAWLMIVGGILHILGGIAAIIGGIFMSMSGKQNGDELFGYFFVMGGVTSIPFSTVLTVGAFRMKSLRSYYLAIASSILSISTFLSFCFCGLLGVFGILMAPIGIWALVMLLDKEVIREFKRGQLSSIIRSDRSDDDDSRF